MLKRGDIFIHLLVSTGIIIVRNLCWENWLQNSLGILRPRVSSMWVELIYWIQGQEHFFVSWRVRRKWQEKKKPQRRQQTKKRLHSFLCDLQTFSGISKLFKWLVKAVFVLFSCMFMKDCVSKLGWCEQNGGRAVNVKGGILEMPRWIPVSARKALELLGLLNWTSLRGNIHQWTYVFFWSSSYIYLSNSRKEKSYG